MKNWFRSEKAQNISACVAIAVLMLAAILIPDPKRETEQMISSPRAQRDEAPADSLCRDFLDHTKKLEKTNAKHSKK